MTYSRAMPLADTEYSISQVMVYVFIIFVLAVILFAAAAVLRRRLLRRDDDQPQLGFTLKDLRQMHAMGQLSDAELKRAEARSKAKMREVMLGDSGGQPPELILSEQQLDEELLGEELLGGEDDARGPGNGAEPGAKPENDAPGTDKID